MNALCVRPRLQVEQLATPIAPTTVRELYRRWRHAIRQSLRAVAAADDLEDAMDVPFPSSAFPSYAGRGIAFSQGEIDREERLLDIDRDRMTAELQAKRAAWEAAADACGLNAARAEEVRWDRAAEELAGQIMAMPARTLEGMHIKAMIGLHYSSSREDPDAALRSIRRDIGMMLRDQRLHGALTDLERMITRRTGTPS